MLLSRSSAPVADDTEHRFGCPHLAYLPVLRYPRHLPPFALWPAFPTALVGRHAHDYYGGSVALGLAPRRRSRILTTRDVRA